MSFIINDTKKNYYIALIFVRNKILIILHIKIV